MKKLIKNEITGWKKWEIFWLLTAMLIIIGLSIYWEDTPMGVISSTTGIICVVCTGKGKLSAYFFGLINSVLYAIIAFEATYYGETMLNLIYYVPMQFIGFYVWSRHMDEESHEVEKRHMKNSGRIILILAIIVGTFAYGYILKLLNDAMPFVDAFTTVYKKGEKITLDYYNTKPEIPETPAENTPTTPETNTPATSQPSENQTITNQ